MSDLIKLNNIVKRNGDIKCFTLGNNFVQMRTGKDGWGLLTLAIDNESVLRMERDELIGVLYIVSKDEWKKESEVS
jgi:hypothetical protein